MPEHAGRFGPVVAALTWQDGSQVGELVAQHAENQASGTPVTGTPDGVAGASERGAPDDEAAEDPAESDPSSPPGTDDATDPGADGTATDEAPGVAPDTEATPDGSPGASEDDTATGGTDGDDGAGGGEDATGPEPESGDVVVRPRAVTPTPEPGGPTAEATAVADLTNAERAEAGCDPLVVDERLTAAAQLHSEDMLAQDYFDHTSLDGRSPWDRAKAQGYANPSGENIAKGQATAADVVRAWMDSPGHRANILNCDFREIGVGYADRVWTQLFGWG
ncbi:CAP domain-containing protein [Cellulosimicrobium terreum]|nr:CAP domain-containing protein [Cellulosimicrobium terreum]